MLRASLRIDAAVCWVVPFVPLRVSSWVRNVTRLLVSATRSSAWKSPLDGAGPTLSRLPPVTAAGRRLCDRRGCLPSMVSVLMRHDVPVCP